MSDSLDLSHFIQKAQTAKNLYESTVRSRVREQLQDIGIGADTFGFANDTPDTTYVPMIDDDPRLSVLAGDAVNSELTPASFSVELLVEQAGKLLDRALLEDAGQRAMRIAQFNLWLDLEELEALTAINDTEVAEGLDEVPLNDAKVNLDSERANFVGRNAQVLYLKNNAARLRQLAAWATEVSLRRPGPPSSGTTVTFGVFQSSLPETQAQGKDDGPTEWLASVIAYEIAHHQFWMNQLSIEADRDTSGAKIPSLEKKVGFFQKNLQFQAARRAVARLKLNRRIIEASRPNGCLNYTTRIKQSEERIIQDIIDAYKRMVAIQEGLRKIFGVEMQSLPVPGQGFVDGMVRWLRDAQDQLEVLSIHDKACALRISLKDSIGPHFAESLVSSSGLRLQLPISALPNARFIRLRGVSSTFLPTASGRPDYLSLRLSPPTVGKFNHTNTTPVSDSDGRLVEHDQPATEGVLGRVQSVLSPVTPDIIGAPEWNNISPFGIWTLHLIEGRDWSKTLKESVEDIFLDFLVEYQAVNSIENV
jgi:hypothetical protein